MLRYVTLRYVTLYLLTYSTILAWHSRHATACSELRVLRPAPTCPRSAPTMHRDQSRTIAISLSVIFLPFPFSTFLILSPNPPRFVSTYPERGFSRVTYQIYALKLWILPRHILAFLGIPGRPWRPNKLSNQLKYCWIELETIGTVTF